ncbi:hypothetical protein [Couchioplanes caeruleus]|uniref:Uncharacterized protein n=1 Tax=Couchioplanes caeruleus TaxID=56438 RepID=A0A3N1GTP3_9ACTN|nr:hypothetical protein [Couchioplanes caeruleus]ROP33619.1 hypothetical protein EDD30_6636 [Couchioplanes caeruleus]
MTENTAPAWPAEDFEPTIEEAILASGGHTQPTLQPVDVEDDEF